MSEETMEIEVLRYRPEQEDLPTYEVFEVPYSKEWVVLDALNHIKDHLDGTLSYRWSCHMAVCGSCGMMVNGEPKLTCKAFLRDYYPGRVKVEPLKGFPIERDLVIDMNGFMEDFKSVKPWIIRNEGEEKPVSEGEYIQTPAQLAHFKEYSMCINCMLCYAACPQYALEPKFIGPAVIAMAQRYNLDSRDQGSAQRAEVLFSPEGVWECTFVGECSEACPKDVDPAAAIQQGKISGTLDWFKSFVVPKGTKK